MASKLTSIVPARLAAPLLTRMYGECALMPALLLHLASAGALPSHTHTMIPHQHYLSTLSCRVSWCLPCGLGALPSVIPYFYCLYFAALLVHRERRDDQACRKKYGR